MIARGGIASLAWLAVTVVTASAADLAKVTKVDRQPLAAQARRVADALDYLGVPLSEGEKAALEKAAADEDAARAVGAIQAIFDPHCLAAVRIRSTENDQLHMEALPGPARPELAEQGWRVFLVKVENPQGVSRLTLKPESPQSLPISYRSRAKPDPRVISIDTIRQRFLDLMMYDQQPMVRDLSGLELEYRIVQVFAKDAGRRAGQIGFSLWKDEAKKPDARSNLVEYVFDAAPAVLVKLRVADQDGKPVMASFIFKDARGRVYPPRSRRLAPDFPFHEQIYRTDGETVLLQPGKYTVAYTRGPEYLVLRKEIVVPASATHTESFQLKRWVHPAARGWYSGDHHIHAAGCAHYDSPTEGVTPEDMMRHVLGEGLNVGCCLNWGGPCWHHQKRYFEGRIHPLSTTSHLLRYDVEVSGFPSSHCGHICLLRLREQDYPGTKLVGDWPSWNLPVFRWAKSQGSVVGYAHTGWGLAPENPNDPTVLQLPNYIVPRMDGIGANEYLVDVAHGMCDFISAGDTPSNWELNIWYHTLNCGYRARISGETDFPCIYDQRVGLGRSYVHLDGKLDFDRWVEGIKQGRCYIGDGLSHLMDFTVHGTGVGSGPSEVRLAAPGTVKIAAKVAAWLEPMPTKETEVIRAAPQATTGNSSRLTQKSMPYWHVERARVGNSRKVPVEVVVNGIAVAKQEIEASGAEQDISFEVPITHSSWVCLRIYPSSHTNPVFVLVNDKPIRVSKRSAEWCLKGIDNCWEQKKNRIRAGKEREEAEAAFEQARAAYKKILAESVAD